MPDRLYYVTVRDPDDPKKFGFLLGPYPTHDLALDNVERGCQMANKANCWATFYAYGTASLPMDAEQPKTVFGE